MVTINHNTYLPYTVETKLSTQMIDVFSSGNGERDISLDNSSKLTYLFIATGDAKVKLSLGTI
ncbi:hypothetical protein KA013_05065 [Patescibacteria group bacterium]|nr:hypothetical protein [Patescibacteria group bacterium]